MQNAHCGIHWRLPAKTGNANGKFLDGALRLRSPVPVGGDRDFAHGIDFDTCVRHVAGSDKSRIFRDQACTTSSMRLANPHSLSNHMYRLANPGALTCVWLPSILADWGF